MAICKKLGFGSIFNGVGLLLAGSAGTSLTGTYQLKTIESTLCELSIVMNKSVKLEMGPAEIG